MLRENETTLHVEEMTCGSCARHVQTALRGLAGVRTSQVDLGQRVVHVRYDPAAASLEDLVGALRGAGYTARAA